MVERIAGIFIDGIAGMENTVVTVASVTGALSGWRTLTSSLFSPAVAAAKNVSFQPENGRVGGTAVAVASDEAGRSGRPDPWKRERLIDVGADLVIPDYRDWPPLLDYLWGEGGAAIRAP